MTPQSSGTENRTSRRAVGARVSALFDENASMVLGLCRLLLRDHHEAEDACQQTFVSAYRALLRGTEPREVGPWLAAIARNECRARLRKRMRAPIALDSEIELELSDNQDLAEVADRRAELAELASEIARLPSRQREAIALRDFLGLSYEEVASTLSVSVPVVESLLFRARRRLRDSVRRVPRYAAGLIFVPFALRAAVARDIPEFDSHMSTGGLAATAGAAAGAVAKLLSLPFGAKVAATTVALVAAGSVVAPTLIHEPGRSTSEAASAAKLGRADGSAPGRASHVRAHHSPSSHAAASHPAAFSEVQVSARGSSQGGSGSASHQGHATGSADPARTSADAPGQGTAPPPAECAQVDSTAPADQTAPSGDQTTTPADATTTAESTTPTNCSTTSTGDGQTSADSTSPADGGATTDQSPSDSTGSPPPPPPPPPADTAPSATTPSSPPPPPPPA